MRKIFKNTYPVCFLSDNTLLLFKKDTFHILDIQSSKYIRVAQINLTFKERFCYFIPFLPRLLRMGIRTGIKISDDIVLFVRKKTIYEFNLKNASISNGFSTDDNSRPMGFSKIISITGFEDGIYFGGYLSNPTKQPVSIYKRESTDKWNKVYQFPMGSIEHIHNIIADRYNNCVYIFTGDFNQAAGIWLAKDNFSSVQPLLIGDQKFRGCVAFPTPKGLLYATDSPFTENSIRILTKTCDDQWISETIQYINGPSLHGCEWNGSFIFSTSVEGDGRNQNLFYKLLGRDRGIGVKNDSSYIYKGDLENGFNEIYNNKKDFLPFFLFQFGLLAFPSGANKSKSLPIYHIATKNHSMSTYLFTE